MASSATLSQAAYQLCFNCHNYAKTVQQSNAYATRHGQHAGSFRAPCITCHNNSSGQQGWQNIDGTGHQAADFRGHALRPLFVFLRFRKVQLDLQINVRPRHFPMIRMIR